MTALEQAWQRDRAPGYWGFWQEEWTRRGVFIRVAEACAAAGDRDGALAALERAHAERQGSIVLLAVLPLLAPLHGDPRFAELVQRMKLPMPAH